MTSDRTLGECPILMGRLVPDLALAENRLTAEQKLRLVFPNQALHARAVLFAWRGQPVEFQCAP